jgi:hypothetical protein
MPDLRTPAVLDWLQLMRHREAPGVWPPPIRPVETSPQTEMLLAAFGQLLDQEAARSPERLSAQLSTIDAIESLQQTIAQLGAARTMRIMHWFREAGIPKGVAIGNEVISGHAQAARAIRECVTTVARQAALSRLMSPSRLDELTSAAQAAVQENAP